MYPDVCDIILEVVIIYIDNSNNKPKSRTANGEIGIFSTIVLQERSRIISRHKKKIQSLDVKGAPPDCICFGVLYRWLLSNSLAFTYMCG